jgi:ribosomal protein L40E
LKIGSAKIPVVGTGIVDSDYICPKCEARSPIGSDRCVRCKKYRYYDTPEEGASGLIIFLDNVRNFPELINENTPECPWCAEVFWFDVQPKVCPSCDIQLLD